MSKRAIQALRRFTWSPLICFGLTCLFMQTEVMEQVAWRRLDWCTNLRVYFQPPPDPRISIILFEDDTEMNLVSWPPDRAYHGTLVELLSLAKPAVVTWDVILDAVREGDGDGSMGLGVGAAMAAGTKVVTGSVTNVDPVEAPPGAGGPTRPLRKVEGDMGGLYGDNFAIIPFPQIRQASWYGFVDAPRSSDGIIREVPLIVRVGKEVYPSLALQTLMAYFNVPADDVRVKLGEAVFLPTKQGELRVPISGAGMYFINYRYDHDDVRPDFPTHSYREVLLKLNSRFVEQSVTGPAPPDYRGKIVLIGQTVTGKADAGPTPRGPYSPLVLVHANVVDNILKGDFAHRVPEWMVMAGMLVLGYLYVWLAAHRSLSRLVLVSVLLLVIYSSLVLWSWVWWSLSLPWVGPLLGFTSLEFILIGRRVWQEQKAKQEIKGMFGSYVSPELVEQLVNSGERPRLGGHQAEITAYFSDIQSFSTFSEKLPPDRLVELMNEYLTVCTDIVQEEGGTLDKYIGDAVVAMFGAPIPQREHAYHACVATQRVQCKLGELCEKWRSEGDKWPEIVWRMQTRIGLNSGHCIVGNMGSRTRFNYTMMGDDVNLAARMESGAKSWGVYTMCSEATKQACEEHGGDRVVFRPLGRIVVNGRAKATPIYEIMGLKESLAPTARECIAIFAQALDQYYARDWNGAKASFRRSADLEPNPSGKTVGGASNPSLVYLDIIEHYQIEPPAPDWDGVYIMKGK
jgi:adenylate cyclase